MSGDWPRWGKKQTSVMYLLPLVNKIALLTILYVIKGHESRPLLSSVGSLFFLAGLEGLLDHAHF